MPAAPAPPAFPPLSLPGQALTIDRRIAALAARQDGIVARAQLLGAGVSSSAIQRRLRNGRLFTVVDGTYLCGAPVLTERAALRAALLHAGPRAALTDLAAARHDDLLEGQPAVITVGSTRRGLVPDVVFKLPLATGDRPRLLIRELRGEDFERWSEVRGGVRATAPARTLVDLAARYPSLLQRAWREAEYRGRLDVAAVADLVDARGAQPGAGALRKLISAHVDTGVQPGELRSLAELAVLELLVRRGLPRPQVNARVRVGDRWYVFDLWWPDARLVAEVDGWSGHRERGAFERDRERDADLLSHGVVTMRVTWRRATLTPDAVADQFAHVLAQRLVAPG